MPKTTKTPDVDGNHDTEFQATARLFGFATFLFLGVAAKTEEDRKKYGALCRAILVAPFPDDVDLREK